MKKEPTQYLRALKFAMSAHNTELKPTEEPDVGLTDLGDNSTTYIGYDVEYYDPNEDKSK